METTSQEEPMEKSGKFGTGHIIVAVLGGALAGAAAALLVAPKSGRETRRQLGGYLETAKEKVALIPEALKSAGQAMKETMAEEPEPAKKDQPTKRNGHG
jgi:gas vesicle protein